MSSLHLQWEYVNADMQLRNGWVTDSGAARHDTVFLFEYHIPFARRTIDWHRDLLIENVPRSDQEAIDNTKRFPLA